MLTNFPAMPSLSQKALIYLLSLEVWYLLRFQRGAVDAAAHFSTDANLSQLAFASVAAAILSPLLSTSILILYSPFALASIQIVKLMRKIRPLKVYVRFRRRRKVSYHVIERLSIRVQNLEAYNAAKKVEKRLEEAIKQERGLFIVLILMAVIYTLSYRGFENSFEIILALTETNLVNYIYHIAFLAYLSFATMMRFFGAFAFKELQLMPVQLYFSSSTIKDNWRDIQRWDRAIDNGFANAQLTYFGWSKNL
jgi:hypothetical protein